jgi:catechol-2,3-dioxygenase
MKVTQLNHAVLWVSDPEASADFYQRTFGFEVVDSRPGMAVFMRTAGSGNHHDLAVMRGRGGPLPQGSVGLYHLAWEVGTIEELAEASQSLTAAGALRGMSDHGVSKSLYGADPDGIEFEIMWRVPREAWGEYERKATTMPLDLNREIARFGTKAAV